MAQGYISGFVQDGGNPGGIMTDGDNAGIGWTVLVGTSQGTNTWSPATAIPFPFEFYGAPVTQFKASPVGLVTFDVGSTTLPNTNDPLPSTNLPDSTIAALWDEFPTGGTGTNDDVEYKVFGTAPNRQLWIRWFSMTKGTSGGGFFYGACVLEESSNNIYVVDMWSSGTSLDATVGLQLDATNALGLGSTFAANPNTNTQSPDNDYWFFAPQTVGTDLRVAAVEFSDNAENGCGTATEPITVELVNVGTNPVTNPLVSFSVNAGAPVPGEAVPATLQPGDTVAYTLSGSLADLSTPGFNSVTGLLILPSDVNPNNNSLTDGVNTVGAQTLPLPVVDFTGFNSGNLPTITSNLWYEATGFPVPDSGTATFYSDNFGNSAASPNGTAATINLWLASKRDWIIGPKILAQSNTALSYDIALAQFGSTNPGTLGSDDEVQVLVSDDCGATWTAVQTFDASSTISPLGQTETISLGTYAGQEIIVAFYATEGTVNDPEDNEIFLDNIFFYNQPPIDVGVSDIIQPSGGFCATATGQAEVEITNYGSQPVSFNAGNPLTITMVLSGANTGTYPFIQTSGSLPPGGSVILPISSGLTLLNDGITFATAYTSLPGDGLAVNDTSFASFDVDGSAPVALPLQPVDFTGFNSGNLPTITNNLWYEAQGAQADSSFSIWVQDDFGNVVGGPNGTAAKINLFISGRDGWIIGPKITPQAATVVSYDVAITQFGSTNSGTLGSDDALHVLATTDCGGSWDTLQTFDATSTVNPAGQNEIVSLAAYAGQDVRIAFYATEGPVDDPVDNDVFLDNIQIFSVPDFDLRVATLEGPDPGCLISGADSIFATVINNGIQPIDFSQDSATFTLTVSGPLPQTLTQSFTTGTSNPGDTIDLLFLVDFSQGGLYNLELLSTLAPDSLPTNDTLDIGVESGAYTAPYYEPFTGFPTFTPNLPFTWTVEQNGTFGYRWQGEDGPTGSFNTGPGVDHTSGVVGGIYLYTEASSGSQGDTTRLISPCIDISPLTLPRLEFWYHMFGSDMGEFRMYVLDASGTLNQEFVAIGQQDSAEAPLDPWNQVVVDLIPYLGQTINLVFEGVRGSSFGGDMAIDDILIYEPTGIDMGAVVIDAPGSGSFLTPQTVGVTITNFEQIPIDFSTDSVTVTLDITGPIAGTFDTTLTTGTLAAGDSLVLPALTTQADFSQGGVYTLTAYTTVNNDAIPFNDTTTAEVIALPLYTPVYTEDFEDFVPDGNFSGNGTGLAFDWLNDPSGPVSAYNWSVGNDNTGSGSTGPDVDHTLGTPAGIYMYTEGSLGSVGDTATLLSSPIDLVGAVDPVLEFWYHMHGSGMGTLAVNIIDNQGNSTTLWSLSGEQQSDETDPWRFAFVNLAAFNSDTIRIEFVGVRGPSLSTDMSIDDVYAGPPSQTDLAAQGLLSPVSPGCLDSTMDLTVQVLSQGQEVDFSTETLNIFVDITGPNPANFIDSVTTGILGVGDTLDVNLTNALNFGTPGTYTVTYYLQFADDTTNVNDTVTLTFIKDAVVPVPVGPVEFIGYNSTNLPFVYPGWNEGVGIGVPEIGTNSGWVEDDFANVIGGPNGSAARINLSFLGDNEWIISPPFVAGSLDLLSFDLALTTGFGTGSTNLGSDDELQVLVSTDCGATWIPVRVYDDQSVISNTGQEEFVNLSGFAGQEIRVAFYATEGTVDDPVSVDLFLDNILIEAGVANNANMQAFVAPTDNSCGDSLTLGELQLQNLGVDTMSSLPVMITVDGPNGLLTFNDTFPGPLALGETGTHVFGPFDTYEGGTFLIEAVAMLSGDTLNANDTIRDTLSFINSAPPRVLPYGEYCPGDSLSLIADTAEDADFLWYDVPTGGTPIASGDTFTTPALPTTPTTYYLEVDDPEFTVGAVDNTIGNGGVFAPASLGVQGLLVDVFQTFTIDSVAVYPDGPGDVFINVFDQATGTLVQQAGPFPVNANLTKVFIPVNLTVAPGSYEFNAEGGTTGLYRNTTGGSYPYEVPGVVSITGNTFSAAYYYFFYDWHISGNACNRPRREVMLMPDLPEPGFAVDSVGDLFLELSNQATNFDSVRYLFGDGGSSTDLNPTYTYADSGTYEVCQVAFNDCGPDTFCQQLTITCFPAEGGFVIDSTGDLSATFSDQSTKADSVVYDFGDGSPTVNAPNPTHVFPDTGTYTVTQIAYHFCGNDTTTLQVNITCNFAVADFSFNVSGLTVDLSSLAQNADSIVYDMGDGTVYPNLPTVSHTYPSLGTYSLCMEVYNVCGVEQKCEELVITSISTIAGGSLRIFPNPAQDQVTLSLTMVQPQSLTVELVDASGRTVSQRAFGVVSGEFSHRFDLDRLAEGMYLVKIQAGEDLIMRKLQVE